MLAGRLVLRSAQPADLDQIGALLADRGEPADAEDLALVVHDAEGGFAGTAVVVDGDRVVSTATLLDETVTIGGIVLPAGQVELVATAEAYEARGLVRALMAWCHDRSRALGQLVNVMVGIPYFYRQFGYEYAVPIGRDLPVDTGALLRGAGGPSARMVRRATASDIPAMAAVEDAEQAGFDVIMPHSAACWRWLVARSGSEQWVAEDADGVVVATGRTTPPSEGVRLAEVASRTSAGALALAAHAAALGDGELLVKERPGTVAGSALAPFLGEGDKPDWYYLRVADPVALLERLRPLLGARLAAAGLGTEEREVLLSCWRWHVRFTVGPGGALDDSSTVDPSEPDVGPMRPGRAEQRPVSKGGSGWPPDGFASLLFGPHGALELEQRLPDAFLGEQRELMAALFPPQRADLLTFYLP